MTNPDRKDESLAQDTPKKLRPTLAELRLLLESAHPEMQHGEKLDWLERLSDWLRGASFLPAALQEQPFKARNARLGLFLKTLSENASYAQTVGNLLTTVLVETQAMHLFGCTGLPVENGFFGEISDRLVRKILPRPPCDKDLAALLERLFPQPLDSEWLANLPLPLLERFLSFLEKASGPLYSDISARIREGMIDALALLAANVASLGITPDIRARMPNLVISNSPFLLLNRRCERLTWLCKQSKKAAFAKERELCFEQIERAREALRELLLYIETSGVSVNLVYRIELLGMQLDRMENIIHFLSSTPPSQEHGSFLAFVASLVRSGQENHSVTAFIQTNIHCLARKVVESSSAKGQSFITKTKGEYWKLFRAAAGGGVLTMATTVLKFFTGWAKFPLFFEGLFSAINYSSSFVAMQFLGFKLATKQPSMTAAALASSLPDVKKRRDVAVFVTQVARITRSQMAAVFGNLGFVIPAALVFHFLILFSMGNQFLDENTATYVARSLNPFASGTLFYGALTGVILWLSSVASGWVENWLVYRRIPDVIEGHPRLRRMFGLERTKGFSRAFSQHISGVVGSVVLGVFLGMTPVLGTFFGLPLDVRHVTLSTGSLTFASASLGLPFIKSFDFFAACLGIVFIGILNFGVSFLLALSVAFWSQRSERTNISVLFKAVFTRFLRSPREFFFPPSKS